MFKLTTALATAIAAFITVDQARAEATSEQSRLSAGTAAPSDDQLGEITVTAERREERLRDVPMTVSVLSAQALESADVTSTTDLQRTTSGLQLPLYGAFMSPSLRGVSGAVVNAGGTANVALYIDGVYQPSQIGELMDLPDVQQIQILKGPQGTLYGQNAESGAIIITTLAPSFTPTGMIDVAYGNYNDRQVRGYLSGPLVADVLAGSISGGYEEHNGFRRSLTTGAQDQGLDSRVIRGKLLFKPSDTASLTLTGAYTDRSDSSIFTGVPYNGITIAKILAPSTVAVTNPDQYTIGPANPVNIQSWTVSLLGKFDLQLGELDFVSSYGHVSANLGNGDIDASPLYIAVAHNIQNNRPYNNEITFVSKKSNGFQVTAGASYLHVEDDISPNNFYLYSAPPAVPAAVYPASPGAPIYSASSAQPTVRQTFAFYADLSYDLTQSLTVTAGARYTNDTEQAYDSLDPNSLRVTEVSASPAHWTNTSPEATVRYKLNDISNVYFSYSEGFKSGLIDAIDPGSPAIKPETLTSYEVGYKANFDRLTLNLSAFWYNYKNKQVSIYVPPAYLNQNAASARIKGVDLDTQFVVTRGLTVSLNAEYLNAKYIKFPDASVYAYDPVTAGLDSVSVNESGQRLERAPTFTGTLGAEYHVDTAVGRFAPSASLYHSSTMLWDPNGLVRQNAYNLLNAEFAYLPVGVPGLRVAFFGSNLTNKTYLQSYLETSYAALVTYSPPRQYGLRLKYQF